jgi:hypothetical protein
MVMVIVVVKVILLAIMMVSDSARKSLLNASDGETVMVIISNSDVNGRHDGDGNDEDGGETNADRRRGK